jgi:dimeric dUTPase (all-alpha-NTP-PPase superfamily)
MTITLEQLYEMQKELDARIIREKGLEGQDLLPNTVLALQVEICELANEWRGFKHWSSDREPRTIIKCMVCNGKKEIYSQHNLDMIDCPHCDGTGKENDSNPLLEEYVDCLHFFLSLARQLNLPADDLYIPDDVVEGETSVLFTELLHNVGMINGNLFLYHKPENVRAHQREYFRGALACFYGLGEQRLGFTFDQITAAYVAKNRVNHERQANGY